MKGNRKNIKKISMIGGGEHAMFIDVSKTQENWYPPCSPTIPPQ